MTSYTQKEIQKNRNTTIIGAYSTGVDLKRCPVCRKNKLTAANLEKYKKCYTCHMNEKVQGWKNESRR